MKLVVQRVKNASVSIENQKVNEIKIGLLVFVGIQKGDTREEVEKLANKLVNLRIFENEDHKMTYSLKDIGGEVLSISQFTLLGSTKKGHRPNFNLAEEPRKAKELYELFNNYLIKELSDKVKTGVFGADMEISLINDGPVTILYDTNE